MSERFSFAVHASHQACCRTITHATQHSAQKYKLLQNVSAQYKEFRYIFCCDFILRLEDEIRTANVVFGDEATFHLSGKAKHNQKI
jgi:hypothetical protein